MRLRIRDTQPADGHRHGDHEAGGEQRDRRLEPEPASRARRTAIEANSRVMLVAVPSSASPLPRSASGMCMLPIAIRTPSVAA